jgi:hypothetical protein
MVISVVDLFDVLGVGECIEETAIWGAFTSIVISVGENKITEYHITNKNI